MLHYILMWQHSKFFKDEQIKASNQLESKSTQETFEVLKSQGLLVGVRLGLRQPKQENGE